MQPIDMITTTTTEIITNEQKMTETVAMLELAQDVCVVGDHEGFVAAAKTATASFKLIGQYLRASSNLAKCQVQVEDQSVRVRKLKIEYENGLKEEERLKALCQGYQKISRDVKLKAADAFEKTAEAWRVDGW